MVAVPASLAFLAAGLTRVSAGLRRATGACLQGGCTAAFVVMGAAIFAAGFYLLEGEGKVGKEIGAWRGTALRWAPVFAASSLLLLVGMLFLGAVVPRAEELSWTWEWGAAIAALAAGTVFYLLSGRLPAERVEEARRTAGQLLLTGAPSFLLGSVFAHRLLSPDGESFSPLFLPSPWAMTALVAGAAALVGIGAMAARRRGLLG